MGQRTVSLFECDQCGSTTELPNDHVQQLPSNWLQVVVSTVDPSGQSVSANTVLFDSNDCASKYFAPKKSANKDKANDKS